MEYPYKLECVGESFCRSYGSYSMGDQVEAGSKDTHYAGHYSSDSSSAI